MEILMPNDVKIRDYYGVNVLKITLSSNEC